MGYGDSFLYRRLDTHKCTQIHHKCPLPPKPLNEQGILVNTGINNPTFLQTNWGRYHTRILTSTPSRATKPKIINVVLNPFNSREGTPGGSCAPPSNRF
jgi:hypothetical protein